MNRKAYSLVELVVVGMILSLLLAVAFRFLESYAQTALNAPTPEASGSR